MHDLLLVPTPLGGLRFRAQVARALSAVELILTATPVTPELPSGMAVDGCVGVVLEFYAAEELYGLCFEYEWAGDSPSSMSPASGEWLDAQEWSNDKHVVVIGTEDFDRLRQRLRPEVGEFPRPYFVEYKDDGLAITLEEVPAATALSLHFVVAWNRLPEPKECSSWFAVDIPHQILMSSLRVSRSANIDAGRCLAKPE